MFMAKWRFVNTFIREKQQRLRAGKTDINRQKNRNYQTTNIQQDKNLL